MEQQPFRDAAALCQEGWAAKRPSVCRHPALGRGVWGQATSKCRSSPRVALGPWHYKRYVPLAAKHLEAQLTPYPTPCTQGSCITRTTYPTALSRTTNLPPTPTSCIFGQTTFKRIQGSGRSSPEMKAEKRSSMSAPFVQRRKGCCLCSQRRM